MTFLSRLVLVVAVLALVVPAHAQEDTYITINWGPDDEATLGALDTLITADHTPILYEVLPGYALAQAGNVPDCYVTAGKIRVVYAASRRNFDTKENVDMGCWYLSRAGELGEEAAYDIIREWCH